METLEACVARNVRRLREDRRYTVRSLSARLDELGRRILPSGITKIEDGTRRVDVGDLVALAVALDVSPVTLLLPHEPSDDGVQLTPDLVADWSAAWRWALGEQPLVSQGRRVDLASPKAADYVQENRPHESNSQFMEAARFLVTRGRGSNPVRYVVEVNHDGRGGVSGQYAVMVAEGDEDGAARKSAGTMTRLE